MTISELTMAAADSALAADPLFHLAPGGHVGRLAMRYWYFRPELKYLVCQACAEGDGRSVVELEEVACQHRIAGSWWSCVSVIVVVCDRPLNGAQTGDEVDGSAR
jgi:hypothetical protein